MFLIGSCANIYDSFFDVEDPECQEGIEYEVGCNCDCCIRFRGVESIGVVPVETSRANCKRAVAYRETGIGESVRLSEREGIEVGGQGIIGGVLEV